MKVRFVLGENTAMAENNNLISVEEAFKIVISNPFKKATETVELKDSTGRILAEDIYADRDFPPFHRVMMDGIAINYQNYRDGQREYPITGTQPAGTIQDKLQDKESCIEVMTGAIVPLGTDTVVPYESLTIKNGVAKVSSEYIVKGHHIHKKGSDRKKNDKLISKGVKISPAEIGGLATVGKSTLEVYKKPLVAIISTGDELVEVNETPSAHQIRKSNSWSLWSALKDTFEIDGDVFHLKDSREEIKEKLTNILENYDVLLLSGGVSKGKKDFIPEVLQQLKIKTLFHRVAQRPGKPLFFGCREETVIFGFPGNPVSTFICFYKYFMGWYRTSYEITLTNETACLKTDFEFKPGLTNFLQVKLSYDQEGKTWAEPAPGNGSGDLANLLESDGFLELPADKSSFIKGSCYPLIRFRF